jgi:hypothetical protein
MHRAAQVHQRTTDLDRRFAATDAATAREARRLLLVSLAVLYR